MANTLPIVVEEKQITQFCLKHHITKLAFFGSVLRDDFADESDIDVLIEFDPAHVPGLMRLVAMEEELSKILGRKADMRAPGDLSRYFRDEVLRTALVQYAA